VKSVGIDIGQFSIKVAEADASGKNAGTIVAFHEHQLNPDPRADRQLEIFEILRNISAQYDPSTTRFVVALPQTDVSVRLKIFPFQERLKILKSLAFELEDDIPLDVDETVFEAKICELFSGGALVLTLATPNEAVGGLLQKLEELGLDPDIVSAEAIALGNCFEVWQQPPPQNADPIGPSLLSEGEKSRVDNAARDARVIVNIGHTHTLLLVYVEEILVAARSIPWGGVEVADAIVQTFSVPFVEAIRVLQTKSFILMNSAGASRDQIAMSTCVSKSVDSLARSLRLTLLEIKTEHALNIAAIELLGGASQIQNLGPYLTQHLEAPVNMARYADRIRNFSADQSSHQEWTAAVAIGLALEGVRKPRNPAVNFRKGPFARQNQSMQILLERWRPAFVTTCVAFVMFFVFAFAREMIATSNLEQVDSVISNQAKVAGLKGRTAASVQEFVRGVNKQMDARKTLSKLDQFNSPLDVINEISKRVPMGTQVGGAGFAVEIQNLVIDNDLLTIEGRVANQAQADALRKALEEVAIGKSLKPKPVTATRPGGVPFGFEMKVNRLARSN